MQVPGVWTVVLVGFGMVLGILLVLVLILNVEGALFRALDARRARRAQGAKAAPAAAPAPMPQPAPVPQPAMQVEQGIPPQVVAAIAAAVTAAQGGHAVLRAVRRARPDARRAWSAAAAIDHTQPF